MKTMTTWTSEGWGSPPEPPFHQGPAKAKPMGCRAHLPSLPAYLGLFPPCEGPEEAGLNHRSWSDCNAQQGQRSFL